MNNNVKDGHKNKQSYSNTRKSGKEQYYTNADVVDLCMRSVLDHIDLTDKVLLEPCGGTGEFIKGFQRNGVKDKNIVSYDIEPKHSLVKLGNYLETDFSQHKDLVCITNPPFGRANSLSKKFFAHAATHCEYICFLIPKSWRKWSLQNSLNEMFHLVSDIEMPKNCFYLPDGSVKEKDVLNTVFQIWQRKDFKRPKIKVPDHGLVKKIIPIQKVTKRVEQKNKKGETVIKEVKRPDYVVGANFEMIVFGHSCGKTKHITEDKVQAKTTTMYFNIERDDVKKALGEIDFSAFFNNVAYVQALSLQEINYKLNEHFGLENFNWS